MSKGLQAIADESLGLSLAVVDRLSDLNRAQPELKKEQREYENNNQCEKL